MTKRHMLAPVETVEPNPRVAAGDNKPPTPFELIEKKINDLFDEAEQWLNGEPVSSQAMADGIANLATMIRAADKEADTLREAEVAPLNELKKAIQDRYAPLIADTKAMKGKTVLALEACKKANAPWLVKVANEQAAAAAKKTIDEYAKLEADNSEWLTKLIQKSPPGDPTVTALDAFRKGTENRLLSRAGIAA